MNKKAASTGLFVLIILGALFFRLYLLDVRPMHHDEANQAVKFGSLLEKGEYRYDRNDHHGPSLYYLTLPFAWIFSGTTFASITESILRFVPVAFGIGFILLLLLLKNGFSQRGILFAGLFAAISPCMVFYSRFYIQEMFFVFFILGAIASGWRYTRSRSPGWAAAAGFFVGMMYTTKETCIIAFGAIFGALILTWASQSGPLRRRKPSSLPGTGHLFLFLGTAILVSFLLYSSFFQNPKGLLDSVLAFATYFNRAGETGLHSHPWYYYLKMLAFSKYGTGPVWSESLILVLALVGGIAAFRVRSKADFSLLFIRFIVFYTLLSTVVYSLIPYKTPWNLLSFYIGFILLAGTGAVVLIKSCKNLQFRYVIILVLVFGVLNLGYQSFRANFKFYADPRNPYVYAHTSTDFMNLIKRVQDIASHHPDHNQMLIKVITHPDETWPLPWYLRSFGRVGYWQEVDAAGEIADMPLIISSIDKINELQSHLQNNYLSEYFGLRPEVLLAVHIKKDLWNSFLQKRAAR